MTHDYEAYLVDVVSLLKEAASDARRESRKEGTGSGFQAGRAMAYTEVLSLMQSQADSFLIPKDALGLADFDPASDLAAASDYPTPLEDE